MKVEINLIVLYCIALPNCLALSGLALPGITLYCIVYIRHIHLHRLQYPPLRCVYVGPHGRPGAVTGVWRGPRQEEHGRIDASVHCLSGQ